MHELSLSIDTIDLIVNQTKHHQFNKVKAMTLSIGALSCIEPDALITGLTFASRGTVAEGAKINIEIIPATATCMNCYQMVSVSSHLDSCQYCHSNQLRIESGEELKIKNIEVN